MSTIYVITASIRKNRIGGDVTDFVQSSIDTDHELKRIDLADWQLPTLDEGMPSASGGDYETEGANDWAQLIAEADGFIFVTPEYNASIPSQLKNNIDVIYDEWLNKQAMIVSYSGSKAGGASAAGHLQDVLQRLKMTVVDPVSLSGWGTDFDDKDSYLKQVRDGFEQLESVLN